MATIPPVICAVSDTAVRPLAWPCCAGAGSPGQLVVSRDASQHPDASGFLNYSGALQAGNDLKVVNASASFGTVEAEAWCASNSSCEGLTFSKNESARKYYFKSGKKEAFLAACIHRLVAFL